MGNGEQEDISPVGEKALGRHGQTGHKVQRQRPYGDLHEGDGDIGRNLGDAKRRAVEQAEGLVLGQDGAPLEGLGKPRTWRSDCCA